LNFVDNPCQKKWDHTEQIIFEVTEPLRPENNANLKRATKHFNAKVLPNLTWMILERDFQLILA